MDILKSIILNFNSFKENINFDILIISFFIKILLFFIIRFDIFKKIFIYYLKFINKTINKKSKKMMTFFSILLFLNILFLNLIDLFPINFFKNFHFFKNINFVPTTDINITFCLSIISIIIVIFLSIKKIGVISFLKSFFISPIKNEYLYFLNFVIETISFIMKPISLSLRLFGNIFSSEIIFNLIGKMNILGNILLKLLWGMFHYIVLPLQSFIFITLVIIYISQSLKH